jgi:Uma2 family endonuclease
VLVINQKNLSSEPLWKKSSTVTQAASVPLVIELVSTNWQDDYAHKLVDYEILGIPKCWFIDYSNPKSFVNFLPPPPGFGEGWGGVKKLRLLQGLLYLGLGCGMCSKF